jgi:hypothetical protein
MVSLLFDKSAQIRRDSNIFVGKIRGTAPSLLDFPISREGIDY